MILNRRTLTRHATVALAACLAFGAPQWAIAQSGSHGVTINIALEPDGLDPTTLPSASVAEVVHYNVLEGLVKIEESGATTPLLAESWTRDASGKEYTFKLRKGVKFHDGMLFEASAVKFSFDRARAEGSVNKAKKALFDNIANVATPDAHTVVLTLHNANANTLFRLGESTAVILHPATAAQAKTHPIGTGPYRFDNWVKGQRINLTKFDGHPNAAQTRLSKVGFSFISDPATQSAAIEAGDVDVFFNYATQNVSRFQNNSRYQLLVGSSSGKGMLAINNRVKPFDDVRVRRAITHAIDRESFIKTVLEGRGKAIGSHFSPTDAGYLHLAGTYPFDPEKAKALLKEAGLKTPLEVKLTLPPAPYARLGGPVIAADLAKVGILAKIELVDWSQWLNGAFKGQFELTLINHVEPLDYQIYSDPNYYFGYDNKAFAELVQQHAESSNARERQVLFADMQRQLAQDAVNAWIFTPQASNVVRKGLKGLWMNYPILAHDVSALRWE